MRIASAQRLDLVRARDRAIRDALFSSEARAVGLDADPEVRHAQSAAIARGLLRSIAEGAEAKGPVTETELAEVTALHWLEIDRPESFRTAHVLVRLATDADEARRREAHAVARAIHDALGPITEAPPPAPPLREGEEDPLFAPIKSAAEAVSHEGFELVIEALPPVTADGRLLTEKKSNLDLDFARAAALLLERGERSPPVDTPFGVHVIVLLATIPAQIVPPEERRALVRDEVMMGRARAAHEALLSTLRPRAAVDLSANALLELIQFEP